MMASEGNTTDSAGQPWAGRELRPNPFSGDTGLADSGLTDALARVSRSPLDPAAHLGVVAALTEARLYAPIVPVVTEQEVDEHGHMVDNSSDMAMVRLQAADGRECTPGFCSIPPLTQWHPEARPVPIEAERLVLGAVEAGSQLVVLDPGSPESFLLRRPAMFAFVQRQPWTPSWADAEVGQAIVGLAEAFPWLAQVSLSPGGARVHVEGPELGIRLGVRSQVTQDEIARFQQALAADPVVVEKVDSLALQLASV